MKKSKKLNKNEMKILIKTKKKKNQYHLRRLIVILMKIKTKNQYIKTLNCFMEKLENTVMSGSE